MKTTMKLTAFAMAAAALSVLTGCATSVPVGLLYTNVKMPVSTTGSVEAEKTGTATSTSIVGVVAWGDSSVEAAAKNGQITKVSTVDYSADSLFGVYAKYTTTVRGYGETAPAPVPPPQAPLVVVPPIQTIEAPAPVPPAPAPKAVTTKKPKINTK